MGFRQHSPLIRRTHFTISRIAAVAGYGPRGEVLFEQVFDNAVTAPSQSETDLLLSLADH